MKLFACVTTFSAFALVSTACLSAESLNLASYGTTATAPAGVANTAVTYGASGATYNLGTGGIWAAPVGTSSWISFNANAAPGGSYVAPNGGYTYYSTFVDNAPLTSGGTIDLMADDTVTAYLNGFLVAAGAAADPAVHCTVMGPNCLAVTSYNLDSSFFVSGVNTLEFVVDQDFASGTGLDFSGTVATTPEPSSLLLLGTGLVGSAGAMLRRFRA